MGVFSMASFYFVNTNFEVCRFERLYFRDKVSREITVTVIIAEAKIGELKSR